MTDANLNVSRKTIKNFLSELANGKKFIIPDYQRPYNWDLEKCETLWEDIEQFSRTRESEKDDYFLGSIVSYTNEENLEIIDGQQRITSLMLLLRAFYTQLERMEHEDPEIKERIDGLKSQIEQCLWEVDEYSGKANNKEKIKILSDVATDTDREVLHSIMKTGNITKSEDNYTKNYQFFLDSCYKYASKNPLSWLKLCLTILNKCIILPIKCNSQDTALAIFSTLNDRGMPLSDSDIFKAQMYKNIDSEKRQEFVNKWKEFSEICKVTGLSIDDIFRYYTHVIRAENENTDKEIALRRFYLKNYLKDVELDDLIELAKFWKEIKNVDLSLKKDDKGYIDLECRKYLQCLSYYPNDYWKYVVTVFFFAKKDKSDFNRELLILLEKLVAFLFCKFIENPTVNAIKTDIFKFCLFIYSNEIKGENLKFNNIDKVLERVYLFNNSKLTRALVLLHSYLNSGDKQKGLVADTFDIEHIFPKKWQNTNYNGWSAEEAEAYLERLGNKIPFENRLNIQAGNGYFGKKKEKYRTSKIYEVQQLSQYGKDDWGKEDIENREKQMISLFKGFFMRNL